MDEDFFNNDIIERFEQMLESKERLYFETDEFYEIIVYYLDVCDYPYAKKAILYALEIHPYST